MAPSFVSGLVALLAAAPATTVLAAPGLLTLQGWPSTAFNPPSAASTTLLPGGLDLVGFAGDYTSYRVTGTINATGGADLILFTLVHDGSARLWVDEHLTIDASESPAGGVQTSVAYQNISLTGAAPVTIRLDYLHYSGEGSRLQLLWQGNHTPYGPVPAAAFDSQVPAYEVQRQQMKARLENPSVTPWQTYNNPSMGTHVYMPYGFGLDATLVDLITGENMGRVFVYHQATPAIVQPGYHSFNGSDFTELSISQWKRLDCDVTFATSVGGVGERSGQDLFFLASSSGSNCSRLAVLVVPGMYFGYYGTFSQDSGTSVITGVVPGMPNGPIDVYPLAGTRLVPFPNCTSSSYLALALSDSDASGNPYVTGYSTGSAYPLATMQSAISAGRAIMAAIPQSYGPELSPAADAITAVIAWNSMFGPYTGVVTPVSRGWDFGHGYVLFDWDNFFLGYMSSFRGGVEKDIAYSNIIEISLSRTTAGFVPNYVSGSHASTDRTEPQIGAFVIQQVYERWGDLWLVEVTFDSMLSWNDWVWTRRRGEGVLAEGSADGQADLIVLGSECDAPNVGDGCATLGKARLESGLDNSPMYDGGDGTPVVGPVTFNATTFHMELYDVGMTALFLSDTRALIALANATGRTDVIPTLQERFDRVSAAMNQHMWDESSQSFTNVLFNGSFYPRHGPTSFYPMMSGSVTNERAAAMMGLLTSPLGFCINATHTPSPSSDMLIQWYDGKHDNMACATEECSAEALAHRYTFVRVEGQVVLPTPNNASVPSVSPASSAPALAPDVTLYRWVCASCGDPSNGNGDSAVTTDGTTPPAPGYVLSAASTGGAEGLCFSTPPPPSAGNGWPSTNLTLWYSAKRQDYQLCGTAHCLSDVTSGAYAPASPSGATTGPGVGEPLCYAWDASTPSTLPCKYGGSSIERSDVSFFDNTYWRGRTWGPHLQLLYWSLAQYPSVPEVASAREVLVGQGAALLHRSFSLFHQVAENYNGIVGYAEDVGNADPFYHWGALSGFIGILEAGLYKKREG